MSPEALAEIATAIQHLEALRDGTLRPGTPGGQLTMQQHLASLRLARDCIDQATATLRHQAALYGPLSPAEPAGKVIEQTG